MRYWHGKSRVKEIGSLKEDEPKIFFPRSPRAYALIPLKSSETTSQIPTLTWVGKDRVRTAWRHAESGRNAHSASLGSIPSAAKAAGVDESGRHD